MMLPIHAYNPSLKCSRDILIKKLSHQLRPHLANLKSLTTMVREGEPTDLVFDHFQVSLDKLDESIIEVLDYMWKMEEFEIQKELSKQEQARALRS
ncbi:MAG: hypothetical protein AAF135_04120 [Bacteroidota bacterium]